MVLFVLKGFGEKSQWGLQKSQKTLGRKYTLSGFNKESTTYRRRKSFLKRQHGRGSNTQAGMTVENQRNWSANTAASMRVRLWLAQWVTGGRGGGGAWHTGKESCPCMWRAPEPSAHAFLHGSTSTRTGFRCHIPGKDCTCTRFHGCIILPELP